MKVFISWSGDLSRRFATAINEWLPGVIQAINTYFTPEDLEKGTRWGSEISQQLEESHFGIICLTRDNLKSPWVNFEAGALSKQFDKARVCPILFGIDNTDLEGPLAQFQTTQFQKEEIKSLIQNINGLIEENPLDDSTLDKVFEVWWPDLEKEVNNIFESEDVAEDENLRSERDLLEEVVNLTRNIYKTNSMRSRREILPPQVLEDLLEGFDKVIVLASRPNENDPSEVISKFENPIRYLLKTVPSGSRRELSVRFDEILENSTRLLNHPDDPDEGELPIF